MLICYKPQGYSVFGSRGAPLSEEEHKQLQQQAKSGQGHNKGKGQDSNVQSEGQKVKDDNGNVAVGNG